MLRFKGVLLTKGKGTGQSELESLEAALRDCGISKYNLIKVTSIIPPGAEIILEKSSERVDEVLRKYGYRASDGLHCVLSICKTNEYYRLIGASIGCAIPTSKEDYGYISEHVDFGKTDESLAKYAKDLAARMLATSLGIPFDPNSSWDEREQIYKISGKIYKTLGIAQTAIGEKDVWTTVVAAAVLIEE